MIIPDCADDGASLLISIKFLVSRTLVDVLFCLSEKACFCFGPKMYHGF